MRGTHLAVDVGSSNGKLVLSEWTPEGRLRCREIGRFATPRTWLGGHICIDTYRIYDEICACLGRLAAEGVYIDSLGVDSWSSDYGIVTPEGQQLGLPIFYRDYRTYGMPEEVEKVISYAELYPLTTQRRMQDSSLCQLLAHRREMPGSLENGNQILFLADLIMFYFTGRRCSEMTLASYSQLYSMEKMRWEDRVFDLFGLPKSLQSEIVHPCQKLGMVSGRAAAQLGTKPFAVVAPAGHDTSSAVAAVPAVEGRNWAFIATGTWFLVGMELDAPMNLPLGYRFNCSNTGLAFHRTMLKRNVMAMWLFQRCKAEWERMGIRDSYAEMDEKAAKARPFYAMLDTECVDFYNPDDMLRAIADYLRKTDQPAVGKDDVGQIARIMHEAIALKCAYSIACLEKITGQTLDVIYLVGGVSGTDILCRMVASACGKEVAAGVPEASSVGNCLLQACGCGEIGSESEIRAIVARNYPLRRYYPRDAESWREQYARYCAFCGLVQ